MKYCFLFLLLATGLLSFGQTYKITLTGTLTMQTGEQFPYKIIGVDSNGTLTGFAFTYAEPQQTVVLIKGRIDKDRHKVTFREVKIESSHDVHTTAFMCLLHAALEMKNNSLTGPANGMEADNTACTPGVLSFDNSTEIAELFKSHDKYDMEVTMGGPKKRDTAQARTIAPAIVETVKKEEKITAGVEKTFDWHSDSIVIDVWDGGEFDGDKVTIALDGKAYLTRYMILKEKKRISIPMPATGIHSLTILADDEGFSPPNTANLTLTDGTQHYNLLAYNTKGQMSMVKLKRVKTP